MAWSSPLGRTIAWTLVAIVITALYLPMVPPPLFSLNDAGPAAALRQPTLRWYGEIWSNAVLVGAVWTSLAAAVVVGLVTPVLGLLAAMAVRELKMPRLVLLVVLAPLFIPGVSMGLASALFFRQLGIPPSLLTISIVHLLWALPFATLIILTVMAGFDPVYLEAAYMHGANRWRAFHDVELPLIFPGIVGAGTFTMILSFNETERTALVSMRRRESMAPMASRLPRSSICCAVHSTSLAISLFISRLLSRSRSLFCSKGLLLSSGL